mmetsp:Transcript_3280/g.14644  ORF Transcript_3280/g.14644 Transcript_3280/m.14644 type:complete len:347 (-) Transcript_3280:2073-3113(-)
MASNGSIDATAKETEAAQESFKRYVEPVRVYNTIKSRTQKNPLFLKRTARYTKLYASRNGADECAEQSRLELRVRCRYPKRAVVPSDGSNANNPSNVDVVYAVLCRERDEDPLADALADPLADASANAADRVANANDANDAKPSARSPAADRSDDRAGPGTGPIDVPPSDPDAGAAIDGGDPGAQPTAGTPGAHRASSPIGNGAGSDTRRDSGQNDVATDAEAMALAEGERAVAARRPANEKARVAEELADLAREAKKKAEALLGSRKTTGGAASKTPAAPPKPIRVKPKPRSPKPSKPLTDEEMAMRLHMEMNASPRFGRERRGRGGLEEARKDTSPVRIPAPPA